MDKEELIEAMSAKDLFLAFCEKAGIEVELNYGEITISDDGECVGFSFEKNGSFNFFYFI